MQAFFLGSPCIYLHLLALGSAARAQRFICVCTTRATSFASSVAIRLCQIWVLLPRWTTLVWPIKVEPAGAEATKLVLLSIVVVPLASAGRLMNAAAAPSVSAKLM